MSKVENNSLKFYINTTSDSSLPALSAMKWEEEKEILPLQLKNCTNNTCIPLGRLVFPIFYMEGDRFREHVYLTMEKRAEIPELVSELVNQHSPALRL